MTRTAFLLSAIVGWLLVVAVACSDSKDSAQPGVQAAVTSIAAHTNTPPAAEDAITPQASQTRTTPSLMPSTIVEPRPVRYAPGEVVNVEKGIFFVDPRTGAVEGWEIAVAGGWLPHTVSASGRHIAYGVPTGSNPPSTNWRLFDTRTDALRDLPGIPEFSPDESRIAFIEPDGLSITRTSDGTVERTIAVAQFSSGIGTPTRLHWSPDSSALLAWYSETPTQGTSGRLLHVSLIDGSLEVISDRALPWAAWSPDGRRYFVVVKGGTEIAAYDAHSRDRIWSASIDDLGLSFLRQTAAKSGGVFEPLRISPDGSTVTVPVRSSAAAPLYRVYLLDAASGNVRLWLMGAYLCGPHAWTADGKSLMVYGTRGDVHGAHLVAGDGSSLRFLAEYVEDLSPVDVQTGGRPGGRTVDVIDIPSGSARMSIAFTGDPGWDFVHQPLWLTDGRMVVHAPHLGHGGCGLGPPVTEQLVVQFPP